MFGSDSGPQDQKNAKWTLPIFLRSRRDAVDIFVIHIHIFCAGVALPLDFGVKLRSRRVLASVF
jgi:hypothetical protein